MKVNEDDHDPVENIVPIGIEVKMASDTITYGPRVDGDPRKRVNFTIRASLHDLMAAMASERGCSRSHLLESLLLDASEDTAEQARQAG